MPCPGQVDPPSPLLRRHICGAPTGAPCCGEKVAFLVQGLETTIAEEGPVEEDILAVAVGGRAVQGGVAGWDGSGRYEMGKQGEERE